jgi:hypothetical protein
MRLNPYLGVIRFVHMGRSARAACGEGWGDRSLRAVPFG